MDSDTQVSCRNVMASFATLFRYSGNKKPLVPLMRYPEQKVLRVVEPYLGGGGYLLSSERPALGIDINKEIINLWIWFRDEATEERLEEINEIVESAKKTTADNKPDVRKLPLSDPERTYVRVNITGVYVGQLSSWKIYPQHRLPIKQTINLLDRLQNVELKHGDAETYVEECGDLVFLDPPYINTTGNYKEYGRGGIEKGYDPSSTIRLIERIKSPIIFTYGTNAKEIFPDYDWKVLKHKKVPRIRGGGTVKRTEHVCYFNWEES